MIRLGTRALAAAILCSVSGIALAQVEEQPPLAVEPDPPAEEQPPVDTKGDPEQADPVGLEDIVVTATRREERLQDIPVTVTAITSQMAEGSGLVEVRNLTQVVPGYTGSRNAGVTQPVIRGVGSSGISVGDEANVATYVDGVYQADPFTTAMDLVEIERVEVLRGPQGTVFGRNATGGLINVITPDPSFKTRGRVAGRLGGMRNQAYEYEARGYLTGPLSDILAADVAALYRGNDGYVKDLANGGFVGHLELFDIRSKLLIKPSDSAKIILMGEYARQDSSVNAFAPVDGNTIGGRFPGAIITRGPWQYSSNLEPRLDYERYNAALRTQFDLGGMSLETTSGFLDSKVYQESDSDASNILIGEIPFTTEVQTYSQEVRLLSDSGGRLNWLVGAYGFYLDGFMDLALINRTPPVPTNPVVTTTLIYPEIKTKSLAGFAEGTYEVVESLFLTLGARYTTEKREFRQRLRGLQLTDANTPRPGVAFNWPASGTAEKTFNKFTYRGALRYEFAPKANVFVSYGTGFKSGVFNAVGFSPVPVEPETITAIEGGIKADPLRWLRTNLSVYHYDYKDLQVQARDSATNSYILQNAASAKIYGGELEVTVSPNRDLNVRGAFAYTHGEYDKFPGAQVFFRNSDGFGNFTPVPPDPRADASGKRIIRTPRTSYNLGVDWGRDVAGGRLLLVGNLFHSGRVYYDFANNFSQKPYTLINGEVSWTMPDERWRFSLYGKNITNEEVLQQIRPGALSADGYYEPPRRIGIGAEFKF